VSKNEDLTIDDVLDERPSLLKAVGVDYFFYTYSWRPKEKIYVKSGRILPVTTNLLYIAEVKKYGEDEAWKRYYYRERPRRVQDYAELMKAKGPEIGQASARPAGYHYTETQQPSGSELANADA